MLCCPILQLSRPVLAVEPNILPKTDPEPNDTCKNPEIDTNGLKKDCSKTNMTCSKNLYICKMGTCCPVEPELISGRSNKALIIFLFLETKIA